MKKLSSFVLAALLFISTLLSITPSAFAQATSNTVTIALAVKSAVKAADNKVVIFKDGDFQGASQQLSVGSYDIKDLTFGNDQLSSLKVPAGYKVTLYEHGGFQGKSKTFTSDAGWVGDDLNDITSSLKVEPSLNKQSATGTQIEPTTITIEEDFGKVEVQKPINTRVCTPGSQRLPLGHTAVSPDFSPRFPKS